MSLLTAFQSLDAAVRAVCPELISLRLLDRTTDPPTVELLIDPLAPDIHVTQAQETVKAFEWSDVAQAAREQAAVDASPLGQLTAWVNEFKRQMQGATTVDDVKAITDALPVVTVPVQAVDV